MREDFAKLITECYRVNAVDTYRSRRRQLNRNVNEDSPKGESIRKWAKMNYGGKEFGENLAPIKSFLLSKVGQNWDEVHSEIAAVMDKNSTIKYHVWQHLMDYVEIHTYMENGRVHYNPTRHAWRSNSPYYIEDSWALVYVHPRTNKLCKVPKESRKYKWRGLRAPWGKKDRIIVDDLTHLYKVKGIWYEVKLMEIKNNAELAEFGLKHMAIIDQISEKNNYVHGYTWLQPQMEHSAKIWFGKENRFAISKRQLNSKELKKHKISNDPIIKVA